MKIEAFQTLQVIVETGSMAKAAQLLNMTPSAVSMQIKQLEGYMGAALFDRSGQSIKPKPLAQMLVAETGPFLQRLETLRRRPEVQIKGVVRLGMLDTMLPLLLPRTLQKIQADYPQLQLQLERGKSRVLQKQVKSSDVDLAVLAQPADFVPSRGLVWLPLLQRKFVLIAPPGSVGTAAALLQQHRLIAYDRATTTGVMASRYLESVYGIRKPYLEYDSIPAIVSMVSLGLGVSVLQIVDRRLLQMDSVEVLELDAPVPQIQYAILAAQESMEKRNVQAMVGVLQAVCSGL